MKGKEYKYAVITGVLIVAAPIVIPVLKEMDKGLNFTIRNPLAQVGIPTSWVVIGIIGVGVLSIMGGKKEC